MLEFDKSGLQNPLQFTLKLILSKMSKIALGQAQLDSSNNLLDVLARRQMHVPAFAGQPFIKVIYGKAPVQKLSDTGLDLKQG